MQEIGECDKSKRILMMARRPSRDIRNHSLVVYGALGNDHVTPLIICESPVVMVTTAKCDQNHLVTALSDGSLGVQSFQSRSSR